MWFRNLRIYRFTRDLDLDAAGLAGALSAHAFTRCAPQAFFSIGWAPPLGDTAADLVHAADAGIMICLAREERLLPASVVNDALREKIEQIRQAEDREIRRRERLNLKDEITAELLPRAFTRTIHTRAYIDTRRGWLVIDAASLKKAEELITALRSALGSLPVVPLRSRCRPSVLMTDWLKHGFPSGITPGNECELLEPGDEGGIVRCKHVDLNSDEIAVHVEAGKFLSRLAINWRERIDCQWCDDWAIKRLGFDDIVHDGNEEIEDAAARFDADFVIQCREIGEFLDWLLEQADGIDDSETPAEGKAA